MNKELRRNLTDLFRKIWNFVGRHNAPVIVLELAIFAGVVFALAADPEPINNGQPIISNEPQNNAPLEQPAGETTNNNQAPQNNGPAGNNNPPIDMAGQKPEEPGQAITYPPQIRTDRQKLEAVYNLLEEMRVEHNRQGDIANSDWGKYQGKWQQYTEIYRAKTAPLRAEYLKMKDSIRKSVYTDIEWGNLMDTVGGEQKAQVLADLYGDRQTLAKIKTEAISPLIDQLKAINLDSLNGQFVDPYEDWTTYTETDSMGVLTVAANQITFTDIQRQSASTVYADKGAGHFGATFQHLIDTRLTAQSGGDFDDMAHVWGLANIVNPTNATDPLIALFWNARPTTGNAHLYLMVDDGATDQSDPTGQIALNTIFYLTIDKNAVDTDAYIYSDSNRTTLLDTLTVANGATTYQYIHNGFTRGGSSAATMSGDIYNLDLQEAATYQPRPPAISPSGGGLLVF